MSDTGKDTEFHFEGEEANAGYASPSLDFIASAVLIAISVVVMVASIRLPVPGAIHTAPGLVPFLVAASLMLMALGLASSALTRHRAGIRIPLFAGRNRTTDIKTLILAAVIAVYIAALQLLAFQWFFSIGPVSYSLSAFEPVTFLALTTIIKASWRGPLWISATVSFTWTLILSIVFQMAFKIPLPGSF